MTMDTPPHKVDPRVRGLSHAPRRMYNIASMKLQLHGRSFHTLLMVFVIGMVMAQPAAAYTDPGSGALILQMVGAALVGGLFYFRKILSFFRRDRSRSGSDNG